MEISGEQLPTTDLALSTVQKNRGHYKEAFGVEIGDRDLAHAFPGKAATIRTVAMLNVEHQRM